VIRPALTLAALLFPAVLASAARAQPSFDCTAAMLAVEQAICGSARLSTLDLEMSQAYLRVGGLPGVAAGQRAWLARRNRECGAAGQKQEACLASLYAQRLSELRGMAGR
jgi:uncharacterized protein